MDNYEKAIEAMKENALCTLKFAEGYYNVLKRSLLHRSRFRNDVLYGIITICFEKLMVALMSSYNQIPISHTPIMLFKDAQKIESRLSEHMLDTTRLINRFESICSLDGFGYKTPSDDDIKTMIIGLKSIYNLVVKRITIEI